MRINQFISNFNTPPTNVTLDGGIGFETAIITAFHMRYLVIGGLIFFIAFIVIRKIIRGGSSQKNKNEK